MEEKKKPFAALLGPVDSCVLCASPLLQKSMLTLMAAFCVWEKAVCLSVCLVMGLSIAGPAVALEEEMQI